MKNLIGKKVKIISDNENYDDFTHASNEGNGYDDTMYPEMLCDFRCESGKDFPFALYEYEFKVL